MVTVNNVFAHWVKEIDVKSYGDDLQVAPSTLVDIYQYFDAVIKRMHSLVLSSNQDRRLHNSVIQRIVILDRTDKFTHFIKHAKSSIEIFGRYRSRKPHFLNLI